MKNTVQNFLKDEKEQRGKNIILLTCFIFISVSLSFLPDIYFGLWDNMWFLFFISIFLSSIFLVQKMIGIDASAYWFLLGFNGMIFYFASSIGEKSNLHFLFFVSILLIPSVLNIQSKRHVLFHIISPLLFLLFLVLFDFDIFAKAKGITPVHRVIFGKVNTILLVVILPVVVWVLVKAYQDLFKKLMDFEKSLIAKNIELSKTNQELDNFVYSVSHDLRAPISSVLGLIAISKMETDLNQLQYYETLKEKSLLKLDSFIKDILDYSRNTRIEVVAQKINWQEYITELLKQFEYLPEAKDIEIEINITQFDEFHTDLYRVGVIFNNILSNAFRYSDKQKEFSYLKIKGTTYKEKVCISFQDNGIGIEKEHQQKVFEMFYRASEESKGSGLGLYILKETLEKINGTIKLNSEIGKGSLFYIEIPNLIKK